MGVPIKSNNTQQGCNPISSNCVIWQGPDIPCVKICTGDSVSDVVAKMATELCEITSQLDISLLDLSCFNPLYPTPKDFKDVMQIILNKICALESGTVDDGKTNTSGCPQDCEVQVAACLQSQDYLGNTVTTLPLKDYVILIGNKICTILTDIAGLQDQIDSLDTRVTNLENNASSGSNIFDVTSDCVVTGTVSLQEYISALDTAFCDLQGNTGTQQDYGNLATAAQCVLTSSLQFASPPQIMGSYSNWVPNPANVMNYIQNLWVTVCDLRTGLTNLQERLNECCAEPPACPNNLPRITVALNKQQYDNKIYFGVTQGSGFTIAQNNAGVIINGETWKIVSFNGTIQTSNNTTPAISNSIIQLPLSGSSYIVYDGNWNGTNILYQDNNILNSLSVTVTGSITWENTTGQQCSEPLANSGSAIQPYIQQCPIPPGGSGTPNFTISPALTPCTGSGFTNVSVGINWPLIQNTSGSWSVTMTANIPSNGGLQTLNFNNSATTVIIPAISCSQSILFTVTGVTQNSYTSSQCSTTGTVVVPIATPGSP
ncbi:MAG: hypothetical protein EBU90_08165 [Proteobacteria bacterium]|nr:hypothetical protein [Pseudomonadota bacterium]NBP14910.1 hypothetical protein [bacterium]